jgi:hypothetical protein
MKSLEPKIIAYAISHWQKDFGGISAINVSEHFDISHEKVLKTFDILEKKQKGSVRRNVTLYQLSISIDNPQFGNPKEINTSFFYPSKDILTESFYSNEFHRKDIPEYKSRSYKGYSQIQLFYFDNEVLRRYLDHREIYEVDNTVAGGYIHLSHDYLSGLSQDELDKIDFPLLRFGKRLLSNSVAVITVILHDLSELPGKEQAYWNSHEIEEPQFDVVDNDFEIFFRRNFEAEFLDDNDPLEKALEEVSRINSLVGENGLFSAESNPYLSYPAVNTYKSFSDSCSELYKIIGPDSLNKEKLKYLLQKYFNYSQQDFVHPKTERPLGELNLLKHVCEKTGCDDLYIIIEKIKTHRISADHKITTPQIAEQNYITEFRQILQELGEQLNRLAKQIENLKSNER